MHDLDAVLAAQAAASLDAADLAQTRPLAEIGGEALAALQASYLDAAVPLLDRLDPSHVRRARPLRRGGNPAGRPGDVGFQRRLVALDREEVIAAALDDEATEVGLAKIASPLMIAPSMGSVLSKVRAAVISSFRRNKKHDYLLRCLLKCGSCGLGIHGCYFPAHGGRIGRRYYRCAGTDPLTTGRETKCTRACIEADALEQSVWDHVVGLLGDPAQLVAQFEQFVAQTATGTQENAACRQLQARVDRVNRADRRLLEAYQAEVISLAELSDQRRVLAEQRSLAEQQYEQHRRLRQQSVQAQEALTSLTAFSERIRSRLHTASVIERQAILQLVVERIIVHDSTLEIQHVIPLRGPTPGTETGTIVELGLCSDGVGQTERELDLGMTAGQPLVAAVPVDLENACEALDLGGEIRHRASVGIDVSDRRRGRTAPRAIINGMAPELTAFGAPASRIEDRHRAMPPSTRRGGLLAWTIAPSPGPASVLREDRSLHPHKGWDHVESLARLRPDPMERTGAAGADRGLGLDHLLAPRQVLGKRADVAHRRPAGAIHLALALIVGGRWRRGGPDGQIVEIERELGDVDHRRPLRSCPEEEILQGPHHLLVILPISGRKSWSIIAGIPSTGVAFASAAASSVSLGGSCRSKRSPASSRL